jgi:hypothetical protein
METHLRGAPRPWEQPHLNDVVGQQESVIRLRPQPTKTCLSSDSAPCCSQQHTKAGQSHPQLADASQIPLVAVGGKSDWLAVKCVVVWVLRCVSVFCVALLTP